MPYFKGRRPLEFTQDAKRVRYTFPKPSDLKVNMMPFIMGSKDSLPANVQQYWPLVEACELSEAEKLKVGYLTITESTVAPGTTQRVPGLHIDAPGLELSNTCARGKGKVLKAAQHGGGFGGGGTFFEESDYREGLELTGGMYLASTVGGSCRVWPATVTNHAGVVGPLGDAEHFRPLLGGGHELAAGELVWLTDRTPHESLPSTSREPEYRQFFHLTTSNLSFWYSAHNTKNPLGIEPPATVTVVSGNKFDVLRDAPAGPPASKP